MDYEKLLNKYKDAIKHIADLEEEIISLKIELGSNIQDRKIFDSYKKVSNKKVMAVNEDFQAYGNVNNTSSNKEKVEIYLSLFRGRENVCAKRWESNKTGNVGYSPYCLNEWIDGLCGKKNRIKCSKCKNQKFIGLDENTLRKHFKGEETLGVYPIDQEDMCYLVVMDFDKDNWQEEVKTVVSICKESNISCHVERSRSGDGGHVWYFFEEKMTASKARKFALAILDTAMDIDSSISFKAYDRLIPSQDFLIKEGFGNLIALPLQKSPRENNNSVFVDEKFIMIEDQWKYLSDIKKIPENDIDKFIALNYKKSGNDNELTIEDGINISKSDFPSKLMVTLRNGIVVQKKGISSKGIVFLRKMAAYLNPEFYSKQAMRMSTYKTPRMTVVYIESELDIILPIGVLTNLLDEMKSKDINIDLKDERHYGQTIDISFNGELRNEQQIAFDNLNSYDNGVLSATTGFGKTVLGARLIAEKRTSTLILVHTKELALQWIDRLGQFLDINYEIEVPLTKSGRKKKVGLVGQLGGGKKHLTGKIDVALMQSMFNPDKSVKNIIEDYGMVIVDECHHVASMKYSLILSSIKSKFIYGLTATPIRKDGHYRIIFMYCGPIRYKVDAKKQAIERSFEHYLVPRFTSCRKPLYQNEEEWRISDIMKHICESSMRNDLIVSDIDRVVEEGRNPIILTERSSHIKLLKKLMLDKHYVVVELSGRLKTKERKKSLDMIRNRSAKNKMVIIATGKLVGEGFDVPWLDTLFLAMPIAWKGTIAQYAGRLHRESENKNEVRVYDYVDVHINMMAKMYSKRLTAYKSVGYKLKPADANKNTGDEIFSGDNYFKEFLKDIEQSEKTIIISAPFIQKRKFESIKDLLYRKYNEGVRVVVCIKEIEEYSERTKANMHKIYSELENKGINVMKIEGLNYKFAIFDDKVVWYGGVDLLAGNRSTDSAIRILSGALSNELYGALE